jgi:hypothetical protein
MKSVSAILEKEDSIGPEVIQRQGGIMAVEF